MGESAVPTNNGRMDTYMLLGAVACVLVPVAAFIALRWFRTGDAEERQDDLPSLHSVVSAFPPISRLGSSEDTVPSIQARYPEWDAKG